jgi:probable HAF family extracellular repeat protein
LSIAQPFPLVRFKPALCAAFAAVCLPAAAASYTYVEIGAGATSARAINQDGTVVGALDDADGNRSFSWRKGVLTDLGAGRDAFWAASFAQGINDPGVVVGGMYVKFSQPAHAFVRPKEKLRDLGTGFGSGSYSLALDVNNQGEIVGLRSSEQAASQTAFLYRNREFIDLGTLGGHDRIPYGTDSIAYAINNKSQVVGTALPPTYPLHAFIWQDGVMQDLGTLGGDREASMARAINEAGHVAGNSPIASGAMRAFLWINGRMRNLGTLGGSQSYAYGMNDMGQVVGASTTPDSPLASAGRAFVWQRGKLVDLNTVVSNLPDNVTLEIAYAINDRGVIVGATCSLFCEPGKSSPQRAFVLIPN